MIIEGRVTIKRNDEVLVNHDLNTIDDNLKDYLSGLMDSSGTDSAIDDLFSSYGEQFGGTQDNKDGILINVDGDHETMETTEQSTGSEYSKEWRGEWTNETGVTQEIISFTLGHDFNSGTGSSPSSLFDVAYSRYIPSNFDAEDLDTVIIEWRLNITS